MHYLLYNDLKLVQGHVINGIVSVIENAAQPVVVKVDAKNVYLTGLDGTVLTD
jgi:hypothetical protein